MHKRLLIDMAGCLLLAMMLAGCHRQPSTAGLLLSRADSLVKTAPDSAAALLRGIAAPEELDNEDFAHWCMTSGKVTDETFCPLPPSYLLVRAADWYASHGTPAQQVQMLTYLGRSNFAEGDYDRAMSLYTQALEMAERHSLATPAAYTYAYMGDLYSERFMRTEAIKKYQAAAGLFKEEGRTDSYACSLRDIGREYACIDSLSLALNILTAADSVAAHTQDVEVSSSIDNALGNVYGMLREFEKAERYLMKAAVGRNTLPNSIALIDLYITADSLQKAKSLLAQIPHDNPKYISSIHYLYYSIYAKEGNCQQALAHLEIYMDRVDSVVNAEGYSKILDIETRYNHLKMERQIDSLKIQRQGQIIFSVSCLAALLVFVVIYLLYRKRTAQKMQRQFNEMRQIRRELQQVSSELDEKEKLLSLSSEGRNAMQEEIQTLNDKYRELQRKFLEKSTVFKDLKRLSNPQKPGCGKALITPKQWKLIEEEITRVYPELRNSLYHLCSNLSEQDFQYCCFYLYGFDSNEEAQLLNIAPGSVRTKHLRLREKLGITLRSPNDSLYKYLIDLMH